MRIRVSRRLLRRIGRILVSSGFIIAAAVGGHALGRAVTPAPGERPLPVLYAPSVRRTEQYRRRAQAYLVELAALDEKLVKVVQNPAGDVYRLSRVAEEGLRSAGRLDQAVSLDYPPSALVSLQRGLQTVTTGYLEAAIALNTWVGEPTEEHYLTALEALRLARLTYQKVQANPWLERSPPPSDRPDRLPETAPTGIPPDGWRE